VSNPGSVPTGQAGVKYIVVTEDGDSLKVDAPGPNEAATAAVEEWGLEAEPGYRVHVFDAADAKPYRFVLNVEADDAA
jgi:hypothetical protein